MGQGIENAIAGLEKRTPHSVYYWLKHLHSPPLSFLSPGVKTCRQSHCRLSHHSSVKCTAYKHILAETQASHLAPFFLSCSEVEGYPTRWFCMLNGISLCFHLKFQCQVLKNLT